jgi:hypothetical protein
MKSLAALRPQARRLFSSLQKESKGVYITHETDHLHLRNPQNRRARATEIAARAPICCRAVRLFDKPRLPSCNPGAAAEVNTAPGQPRHSSTAPQAGFGAGATGAPPPGGAPAGNAAPASGGGNSNGGGGGALTALALVALPAAGYLAYENVYREGHRKRAAAGGSGDVLRHSDADEFSLNGTLEASSSAAGVEGAGAAAGTAAAAAAAAAVGSKAAEGAESKAAAGDDEYSAAADEFPGAVVMLDSLAVPRSSSDVDRSTTQPSGPAQPPVQIDARPIDDVMREVYGGGSSLYSALGGNPSSAGSSSGGGGVSSSGSGQSEADKQLAAAARIAAAMDAAAAAGAAPAARGSGGVSTSADAAGKSAADQDLSPAALLSAAAAAGYGPKDDWAAGAAQLRQATADAAVMGRAVKVRCGVVGGRLAECS